MDKKACIFDMDGTLVDSMGYWRDLGREFLRKKGVTGDVEEILARTDPMTMEESAELFRVSFGLAGTAQELADEMNAVMDEHYRKDVPLKPGVREYLAALQAQGRKFCVATATPEHLAKLCLARLGVAAGKDRPDVFLEAARRLGTRPEETAVFEDAPYAARTAKQAGFYVVGIYDESSRAHWEEVQAMADETITDWTTARPI